MNVKDAKTPSSVKQIVAANIGQVLTPDNRLTAKHDLEEGYQYRMLTLDSEEEESPRYIYRLTKVDGDFLYFSTVDKYGRESFKDYERFRFGQLSKLKKNNSYKADDYNHCLFTIGECAYKNFFGKEQVIETTFRDGVWISNEPYGRDKRQVVFRVYKTDGLPLYEYSVWPEGTTLEKRRVEIDQSYGLTFDVTKTTRGMPVARAVCIDAEETRRIGVEIRLESTDGKAITKHRRFIAQLEEFVSSDPCLPRLSRSTIQQVKGNGWIFDKPNGEIIIDTINEGISAYTLASFSMGNFDQWYSLTSKRLKDYFEPKGIKAYIKVDP
ncbi:hypothetical protein [Litoribacillus peritrichatus]|uniref:Uncharacterized protein n=1 Tax=Litoribacillus peritrichatus TaxID=718191 RepID=A0ABP7NAZ9_9GAMM